MKETPRFTVPSFLSQPLILVMFLTLVAFGLRVWHLDKVPPGWRDDELINSLVISQKVIDGNWAVYFPDASGHEALYHIMNAGMLALFGPGTAGIRLLSVILGTLTVPLTYLVARQLFGRKVGLVAAAALTFSFWSLMYSRIGIRHISLPFFMLAAFYFYWRGLDIGHNGAKKTQELSSTNLYFLFAGVAMGFGFYTYFASRGVPIILLAATVYGLAFHRSKLQDRWHGLVLMFGISFVMAIPLLLTLSQQPESEARVSELAVPIIEAREGNFQPLLNHVVRTVGMFHAYGDEEWLYNIPDRPLFGPVGAVIFWLGVGTAMWLLLKPFLRLLFSKIDRPETGIIRANPRYEIAGLFLFIWWLVGISPSFVSVPPASLGHTIIAQSATYILIALPIFALDRLFELNSTQRLSNRRNSQIISAIIGIIIIIGIIWRDLPDYFFNWPERGMTRFLYRADIRDLADYLNSRPSLGQVPVSGLLAGPWDKIALDIDLAHDSSVVPLWYNPERAIILPPENRDLTGFIHRLEGRLFSEEAYTIGPDPVPGAYELVQIAPDREYKSITHCFVNGLCLTDSIFDPQKQSLVLTWEIIKPLQIPSVPLVSNPPPPGIYAGPRLRVFAHLIDSEENLLIADDGLWVDISTLAPGDRFRQVHYLVSGAGNNEEAIAIVFGLYDPKTGERILTDDGRDQIRIELNP